MVQIISVTAIVTPFQPLSPHLSVVSDIQFPIGVFSFAKTPNGERMAGRDLGIARAMRACVRR